VPVPRPPGGPDLVDAAPIGFRALTRDDFARLVDWLDRPHVAQWWTEPRGSAAIEADYGPSVDGTDPTRAFLIVSGSRPVGFIQCYRLQDEPEYAEAVGCDDGVGVDLFIGEAEAMGDGFGSAVLGRFVDQVVWPTYPDAACCLAGPSIRNLRSQRAFEKAGFRRGRVAVVPGEDDPEQVMVLPRPPAPT
jgi:aminoglycoside 6'-N-acetyltransferase